MPSSIAIKPYNPPSNALVYTIENANIDSYECRANMAEDGVTPKSLKYAISGSGLMTTADWEALRTAMSRSSARCFDITLSHGTPVKALIGLTRANSVIGGPVLTITGQSIVGSGGLALVRFDITDEVQQSNLPILTHTWSQTMRVDASGVSTRTVSGHVRVWRGKTGGTQDFFATRSDWKGKAPWADIFRAAVVPIDVRQGWRRESQEYALDSQGIELVYTVVDKQYAHELPDGVRVGDFDFSYERSIENPALANVSFTCELEGGMDLRGVVGNNAGFTGNRALIAAAIQLSRTRIDANLKNTLITRLKVTEREVLSKFAIRLEIDAQLLPNANLTGGATVLRPLAAAVGNLFWVKRTTNRIVPPQGLPYPQTDQNNGTTPPSGDIYAMVAHYLQVAGTPTGMPPFAGSLSDVDLDAMQAAGGGGESGKDLPIAQLVHLSDDCRFGLATQLGSNQQSGVTVFIVQPSNAGPLVQAMNEYVGGRWSDKQTNLVNADPDQIISYATGTTRCDVDTGIVIASRMQPDAVDAVFQVRHPMVLITERVEIVQMNKAPQRASRPLPKGAWIKSQRWDVSFGKLDAQGNRTYIGVFERSYQMRDVGLQGGGVGATTRNKAGFLTETLAQTSDSGLVVNPTFGKVRVWDPITNYTKLASDTGPNLNAPLIPTVQRTEQDALRSTIDALQVNPEQSYRPSDPLSTGVVRE
jgi:hypothetical protein